MVHSAFIAMTVITQQTRGRFSCLSPFLNLHFMDPVNGEAGKP